MIKKWLTKWFTKPETVRLAKEEELDLAVIKLIELVDSGRWKWTDVDRSKEVLLVNPSLHEILKLMVQARVAIRARGALPTMASVSGESYGYTSVRVSDLTRNRDGLYSNPKYMVYELLHELRNLCDAIREVRVKSEVRADGTVRMITPLLTDIGSVINAVLRPEKQ